MSRTRSAAITKTMRFGNTKKIETGPDADDKHYQAFGQGLKGVNFGSKYEFKADKNPAPG